MSEKQPNYNPFSPPPTEREPLPEHAMTNEKKMEARECICADPENCTEPAAPWDYAALKACYDVLLDTGNKLLAERNALREQLAGVRNALRICYEQANEAMYAEYAGPHIGLIQDTCKAAIAALPASADEGEGK